MNRITMRVPNWVERDDEPSDSVEFSTLEDLEGVEFVKRWIDTKDFYRLSVSDGRFLMAELEEGRHWWVIGILREPVDFLPTWVPVRESA